MNLQNLDFTPLWITMKTGVAATFVSFFLGIFAEIGRASCRERV